MQTDRQICMRADRQTDRSAGRQTGRQAGRQADRQAGRQADRQTGHDVMRAMWVSSQLSLEGRRSCSIALSFWLYSNFNANPIMLCPM